MDRESNLVNLTTFFNTLDLDTSGISILKKWLNVNRKLTRANSQRQFLLQCRSHDLKPRHVDSVSSSIKHFAFHSKSVKVNFESLINKFKKELLNIIIEDKCTHIDYLNISMNGLNRGLCDILTITEFQSVSNKCHLLNLGERKSFNNTHRIKFESLNTPFQLQTNPQFRNLSNLDIPPYVTGITLLGNKFLFDDLLKLMTLIKIFLITLESIY